MLGISGRKARITTNTGRLPITAESTASGRTRPEKATVYCCPSSMTARARSQKVGSFFHSPLAMTCMNPRDHRVRCLMNWRIESGVSSWVTMSDS